MDERELKCDCVNLVLFVNVSTNVRVRKLAYFPIEFLSLTNSLINCQKLAATAQRATCTRVWHVYRVFRIYTANRVNAQMVDEVTE